MLFALKNLAAIFLTFYLYPSHAAPLDLNPEEVTIEAQSLTLLNQHNQSVSLDQFSGQVVLVNFWASWCAPCTEEFPSMIALKESLQSLPFEILAINVGEDPAAIDTFTGQLNPSVNFPILLDSTLSITREWDIRAMPTTVIIDKTGKSRMTIVNARDWNSPSITKILTTLTQEH